MESDSEAIQTWAASNALHGFVWMASLSLAMTAPQRSAGRR